MSLIKIDVEGAEHLVLEGALCILQKHHPLLMIEIHSVTSMFKTCKSLFEIGYESRVIQEDSANRCFISAYITEPKNQIV